MATYSNAILFSQHFGIDPKSLDDAGLIDPFLNVDLELFIDPVLLEKSGNKTISVNAVSEFRSHFSNIIRLLSISKKHGDVAWKAAERLLNLKEPPENGLGYGGSSRSGSSRSDEVKQQILNTTSDIIKLGAKDPDMISLMGFFEEGVGPDTISDYTTRVIFPSLAKVTEEFCNSVGIKTHQFNNNSNVELPIFIDASNKTKHFLLIPKDIVRDLPIANDWSDVREAAMINQEIRERVSSYLAGIMTPTVADYKSALRGAALSSSQAFIYFMKAVISSAKAYDPNEDALGYYSLRDLMVSNQSIFKNKSSVDIELLSNLVFEISGSCSDLIVLCGFNTVFEFNASDNFGQIIKAS